VRDCILHSDCEVSLLEWAFNWLRSSIDRVLSSLDNCVAGTKVLFLIRQLC
jgi:hypothetical protein